MRFPRVSMAARSSTIVLSACSRAWEISPYLKHCGVWTRRKGARSTVTNVSCVISLSASGTGRQGATPSACFKASRSFEIIV